MRRRLRHALQHRTRSDDGLPPGEGAFLACSFWLADAYVSIGRHATMPRLFERLLAIAQRLGLLAEEYDPRGSAGCRQFPAGLRHVALINTAFNLTPDRPSRRSSAPTVTARRSGAQDAGRRHSNVAAPMRPATASTRRASFFKGSLTALGLALPPVDFMTWPTNQPNSVGLAL